jgi:hypothetical protein
VYKFPQCVLGCLGGNKSKQCNTDNGFSATGVLCATCSKNFVRNQDNCASCPPSGIGFTVVVVLYLGYVVLIWYLVVIDDDDAANEVTRSSV